VAACWLVLPAPAGAHAVLVGSSPERGSTAPGAPATVEFDFSEPVETRFGAIRVFGPNGEELQQGGVFHPGGITSRAAIALRGELPDGTYTATYRVISADSHPVAGGLLFNVGRESARAEGVSQAFAVEPTAPVTAVAFVITRAVLYAALAFALGSLMFLAWPWRVGVAALGDRAPAASYTFEDRLREMLLFTTAVGLLMTLLGLGLQAAVAGGQSLWQSLTPEALGQLVGTRFGIVWTAAEALWAAFGAMVAASQRLRPRLLAVPLLLAAAAPALAGHAATQTPVWLLLPLNVVHVIAMSCWVGGLLALLFVVPAATRGLEGPDRTRLLAAILRPFSTLATLSVGAILVTGIIQSIAEVGSLPALVSSAYGRAVAVKFLLLLVLIGVGAHQRRRTLPGLEARVAEGPPPGRQERALHRSVQLELGLIGVILLVAGALASYAPPAAEGGPEAVTSRLGPAMVNLTVEPATVGQNELQIYLSDAESGDPFDSFTDIAVSLSPPAPDQKSVQAEVREAGPGHYVVPAVRLPVKGEWEIRMDGELSQFSDQTGGATVAIR
jgi:copper transport protein